MQLLASAALLAAVAAAGAAAAPNIVLMVADDLGWNDVGYNGSDISTPAIDRLAAEGMRLDRHYAFPFCTPTRVAIMTGRSPLRFGLAGPIIDSGGLPLDQKTLGEIFQDAGYQTFYVGKWHLGHDSRAHFPGARGWHHSYGSLTGGLDHYSHNSDVLMGVPDWHRNGEPLEEEGHTTDLYTEEARRLIAQRDKGRPFLLFLAWNAPHTPLQAPKEYLARYAHVDDEVRRTFSAMVTHLDDSVAALLGVLQDEGLREETLLVWGSDNGGFVSGGADNSPLRGAKGDPYEGGIRVPGLMNWPGRIEPGVLDQTVSVLDWLPTLMAAAGVRSPAEGRFDGTNMWPAIASGERVKRSDFVAASFVGRAIVRAPWKFVEASPRRSAALRGRGAGVPSGRRPSGGPGRGGPPGPVADLRRELYDIVADPAESRDLASEYPELFKELAAASRQLDGGARIPPPSFEFRDGGRFRRVPPLQGFPEDRGPHVIDRADED